VTTLLVYKSSSHSLSHSLSLSLSLEIHSYISMHWTQACVHPSLSKKLCHAEKRVGYQKEKTQVLIPYSRRHSLCNATRTTSAYMSDKSCMRKLNIILRTLFYCLVHPKLSRCPFRSPCETKTKGRYSSSFAIKAEFSKRFSIAAFP